MVISELKIDILKVPTNFNKYFISVYHTCCCLPNRFSRVRLCATPWNAAYQASLSMGFSRQETGVGCHFLLQCMKVESESEVTQSCLTLSDPMDCSPPGSSIHGIFRAIVLEWGAIAFSLPYIQKCKQNLSVNLDELSKSESSVKFYETESYPFTTAPI